MSVERALFTETPAPVARRSDAVLAVHVIRHHVAEHAAMQEATYQAYSRERQIRRLCERRCGDSLAQQILDILDRPVSPERSLRSVPQEPR